MKPLPHEFKVIATLIGSLWIIHFIDWLLPIDLNQYGLVPRSLHGLIGILTMPFLHGSWGHLFSNTVPLCILLFILVSTRRDAWEVIASIVVFGGLFLWCFGRTAVHVGASGLIYGLVAFLITSGLVEKKPIPILVALVVGFLYGTTLFSGVLPIVNTHISWEGHLFGAIAGGLTAFFLSQDGETPAQVDQVLP